jgi:hypothetical protein
MAQEMLAGHQVLVIDYESSARVWLERFADMGVPEAIVNERFLYVEPTTRLMSDKLAQAELAALMALTTLTVFDAKGEMIAHEGGDLNAPEPVIETVRLLSRLADPSGPGVLIIDHPPGDGTVKKEGFGSTFNKNTVRGVVLHLEMDNQPQRGTIVTGHLFTSKDREGRVNEHGLATNDHRFVLADVTFDSTFGLAIELAPPTMPTMGARALPITTVVLDAITEQAALGLPFTRMDDIANYVERRMVNVRAAIRDLQAADLINRPKRGEPYLPRDIEDEPPPRASYE